MPLNISTGAARLISTGAPVSALRASAAADMQPGSGGQVLARDVMLPGLARTRAEAFAGSAHEEINRVACARRAVRHVVLAEQARRLHE